MGHLIRRFGGETYPEKSSGSGAAAFQNRYLSAATPAAPMPFTSTSPTSTIVAAANVTRTASGLFMVSAQMSARLAAADQMNWGASALLGGSAIGGDIYGDWLLAEASPIGTSGSTGTSVMGVDLIECVAGELQQSVTLVGVNPTPLPQGASTIVIFGTTVGGTQITPGFFLGTIFELP